MVKDGTTTLRNFQDEKMGGEISGKWQNVGWSTAFVLDHRGVIRNADLAGLGSGSGLG